MNGRLLREAGGSNAQNDLEALRTWLSEYAANPSTLASYRREAERLLLWTVLDRKKSFASLTSEDLVGYRLFLADPQPREIWVTARGVRAGRDQDGWRPFAGPLSPHSVRQSLAVIGRLFDWLAAIGHLPTHPLCSPSEKPRPSLTRAVRSLPADIQPILVAALDAYPRATLREREHAERARWLFALLYLGGLRVAEACRLTMGAFHVRPGGDSGQWWITINGTGRAKRLQPASSELMQALIRYRLARGLAPLPEKHDWTPLILPIGGRDQHLKPRVLDGIAAAFLRAASLEDASPDWLRRASLRANRPDPVAVSGGDVFALMHTSPSRDARGAPAAKRPGARATERRQPTARI